MKLYHGDCLEVMKNIPDKSVDAIICDLPYGTTKCAWDTIIPFDKLWEQYNRIIKDNGAIVLFGSEPFSSRLRLSNSKMYKYDWIWQKSKYSNFLCLKKQPAKNYENICVFYKKQPSYNPQMIKGKPYIEKGNRKQSSNQQKLGIKQITPHKNIGTRYPNQTVYFSNGNNFNIHPTQKPVALMEYLIKTYTNKGDVVLDNCMGSGTTGVACKNLDREFIGIELDDKYFEIAKNKIETHNPPLELL